MWMSIIAHMAFELHPCRARSIQPPGTFSSMYTRLE